MASLEELRTELDAIDDQLVKLYEKRMEVCEAVGEYKVHAGRKVYDRQRENEKMADVASKVDGEFNKKGVRELYRQLMSMSRKLQYRQLVEAGALGRLPFIQVDSLEAENARVVYQGTEGAYSQSDIRTVYSKTEALMQTRRFLDDHSDWQKISVVNTAIAAKKVLQEQDKTQAAVCSAYAAQVHGLSVLVDKINDEPDNSTRFIVVTNQKIFLKNASKISIRFEVPHTSGSLYNILSHFIYNDLNMSKIESRPVEGKNWEYCFFVDFEGNMEDPAVKNAIRGLREEARNLKILGNY